MGFAECFPIWKELNTDEKGELIKAAKKREVRKGCMLHDGASDCDGLFLVESGQLRAFILSDEGKEITIYRLFEGDFCLFSASCLMNQVQFDIMVEAEKDSVIWIIPASFYKELMSRSLTIANYTNEIMASRFSDVMWLVEQIMWKSFDKRLAEFLIEESKLDDSLVLKITHDKIAAHLGTAREVVTRMLRYFQSEGMITLNRGSVTITDIRKLRTCSD